MAPIVCYFRIATTNAFKSGMDIVTCVFMCDKMSVVSCLSKFAAGEKMVQEEVLVTLSERQCSVLPWLTRELHIGSTLQHRLAAEVGIWDTVAAVFQPGQ